MTNKSRLPVIALTMGDPAGIGPEIILKSLEDKTLLDMCVPVVFGDAGIMNRVKRLSGFMDDFNIIKKISDAEPGRINLLVLSSINMENFSFGKASTDLGLISTFYIIKAAEAALAKEVEAIVTAPINKAMLKEAGYDYSSQSDMLRSVAQVDHIGVMLVGEKMRITRVTSHMPMARVAEVLTENRVFKSIYYTAQMLKDVFMINDPHIAVCGFNPHAGEAGLFGKEEVEVIQPAVFRARNEGIRVTDPLAAHHVFPRVRDGEFDATICMYHDQGHIPFQLINEVVGVNVTLGLPFIRTSPDHGCSYSLAGKGYASEKGFRQAIEQALVLVNNCRQAV